MVKKFFLLTLVCILVAGSLAACKSDEAAQEKQSESKLVDGKFVPPVKITVGRTLKEYVKFKEGQDINHNVHNKWALETLGIDIEYLWTAPNDEQYRNKIRLSMSAGQELPDVMMVSDAQLIYDLISSGKVRPIDEAIEKYATPRIKKIFNDFPAAFYRATVDGVRYGIPRFSGGNGSDSLLWIRKDWLDKLGLEPPETIAELEKIMHAFVHQDPDGDGKDDTIGITIAGKNSWATWLADASFVFGAYGDYLPMSWSKNEEGDLVYGSIQPSVKKGLAKLREWYAKGYLDKEVAILSEQEAIESFVSGRSGIIAAPPWAEGWPVADVYKNNPDAVVQSYPLPAGPDGNIGRKGEKVVVGEFLFSKDVTDTQMQAFFKYWDAIYGYTLGESKYFKYGLFEGFDYIMVDGKPVYDQEKIPGPTIDPIYYLLTQSVPRVPFRLYDLVSKFYETDYKPQNAYEHKLYAKGEDYHRAAAIVNNQNEHRIENLFDGPPTETMQRRSTFLEKMEKETFANIIYGKVPLDAFDQFVKEWKSSGGAQITKEVNEWYDSVTQ